MPKPPPNIVLLCPDEMGARALGCDPRAYLPGGTPTLDALAAESAHFTQCHVVHTKCTPSRCALLTGQYPHVHGHRTLDLPTRIHENNLVATLRGAGYRTALFGKNHVVDDETMAETFDDRVPPQGAFALEPADPPPMPVGSFYVGQDPAAAKDHVDSRTTAAAVDWLGERAAEPVTPFFLWLNWISPHPPYGTPAPFHGRTPRGRVPAFPPDDDAGKPRLHAALRDAYGLDAMTPDDWRELTATYLDMAAFVDEQARRVLEALDRLGLAENTIVVFWSDHGDFAGEHRLVEKWDTCFLDCLTRVPLLVRAPGRVRPLRSDALVESIDVLPTVLELAGVAVPPVTQGRSLGPVMRGETEDHRDLVLCQGGQERAMLDRVAPWDGPRPCRAYRMKQKALFDDPSLNARSKMIRGTRWKYVYRAAGIEELYDLRSDPDELHNLAGDGVHADELHRQRHLLLAKLVEAESTEPHQELLEA